MARTYQQGRQKKTTNKSDSKHGGGNSSAGKGWGSKGRYMQRGNTKPVTPSAAAEEDATVVKPSGSKPLTKKLSSTTMNLRFMQRGNAAAAKDDGGSGAEGSHPSAHPDRWVLPVTSTASGWGPAISTDGNGASAAGVGVSVGAGRRTVEVISRFSAFESIMETRRSFQNFNPEIEKEAKAEQKAKAKAEEKQYKVHLEQLRKDNEEDVAGSEMMKYFGGNVANAAAEKKRRSVKRKAAKETAREAKAAATATEEEAGTAAAPSAPATDDTSDHSKKAKSE